MNFRYLLLFLLMFTTAFADTRCSTSYMDELSVLVVDLGSRPVEGASVTIQHQYSGSVGVSGQGTYFTIGPKYTDSKGLVEVTVSNEETSYKQLDCEIRIDVSAGGDFKRKTVIANAHPDPVDIKMDIYPVKIYVREPTGDPVSNATVTIRGESKKTDKNGYVRFFSIKGSVDYFVSYLEGKESGKIEVTNDTTYNVVLPAYAISIDVVDDKGDPLKASIDIANRTVQLGDDGHFYDPKIFGEEVEFSVTYAGLTKNLKMYPAVDPSKQVVFDLSSPIIGNISKTELDRKVRLTIPVTDGGAYPSGVDTSSILVTYRIEPSADGQWNKAVTYVSKKNIFITDFPELEPNSLVQFKVEVSDNEGNKASLGGRFTTSPPEDTTTVENSHENGEVGQEFPLLHLVGGFLIVAFILYMFFRLKGKGGGNQ